MRVGVNLLPLFPGQIGGMERYPFELLTHFMEIDHQLRAKHGRQLACVFTGVTRGAHEAFLKAVEKLGLRQQIHVLGYVEEPDMPLLYQGASCLVFRPCSRGLGFLSSRRWRPIALCSVPVRGILRSLQTPLSRSPRS
jgi:hypothetical protein